MRLLELLKKAVEENDVQSFESILYEKPERIFDTPAIKKVYTLFKGFVLKEGGFNHFQTTTLLLTAWLALLSGDNRNLYGLAKKVQEDVERLNSPPGSYTGAHYQALFEDLQALSAILGDPEDRLKHSRKAMALLTDEDNTFFMANANLTHGQILVGNGRLREGADYFFRAYELFLKNNLSFPASVALTNTLLNWFRLGEFKALKTEAKKALMIHSTYDGDLKEDINTRRKNSNENNDYWDIVHLPLGMCYYEEGKPSLALKHLQKARRAIDKLHLIHMHGYVEIYLMKAYAFTEDKDELNTLIEDAKRLFKNMHYPMMEWIVLYGQFLLEKKLPRKDIEHLEASFEDNAYKHLILIELLTLLFLDGQTHHFDLEILTESIANARFSGDVISLQTLLLLLADYYYMKREEKAPKVILGETVKHYKTYGLKASLYQYPFHFWPLLIKLAPSIQQPEKTEVPMENLTKRELDVIHLMAEGKSNNEIAKKLYVSLGTVKWHVNNIFGKLSAKNRIQAIEKAKRFNFL